MADTPFSVSDYQSANFNIYSTDPDQTLSFELWDSGFASLGKVSVPLVANGWSAVNIDFSNFSASNDVKYVQFSESTSTNAIYLDSVFLGDSDFLTPTQPPTETATSTPTTTSTPSGPENTPTPTATATPPSIPGIPIYIYDDAIKSNWILGSWGK